MDPPWHHHRYPPPPPGGAAPHATICPVCSSSHFPFCPPPYYPSGHQYPPPPPLPHPINQFYPRPPPPPPPPQPYHQPPPPASAAPYDPFADHLGGPATNLNRTPSGPWSTNSPYAQVYPGYDHGKASAKRIRFDDTGFNSGQSGSYNNQNPPPQVFTDDERRLRLIRDHGSMNPDRNSLEPSTEAGLKYLDSKISNHSHSNMGNNSLNGDISLKRKSVYDNSHGVKQSLLGIDQFHQRYGVPNQVGCMQNHNDTAYSCIQGKGPDHQVFNGQPSIHAPPFPSSLPVESSRPHFPEGMVSLSPSISSVSDLMSSPSLATSIYLPHSELNSSSGRGHIPASTGFRSEGFRDIQQVPFTAYMSRNEFIPPRAQSPEKHKIFDASHIIKPPHRASRPDHIVIILRGLPGSGKSYLAKLLRDLEVENGGSVPRIHSMDEYFMTEVEKEEATESSKSSGSVRGKKQSTKSVLEYCYEPEMEEAYRSSMLKAFKKTLDEGVFSFVIVDDRNLRVADFAQFWAIAKRSGYEVYLMEAPYKDPIGCAARNVHNFTQEEVQNMADLWEESPCMYFKLDVKSLLHGDASTESGIQEVDMDVEEGDAGGIPLGAVEENNEKLSVPHEGDRAFHGPESDQRLEGEADYAVENVKELGKSKWSNDLDEDNIRKTEKVKSKSDSLSGLKQSYVKEGKSVRWGDEVGNSGFSITAAKTVNTYSLVIGPGSGYTSKSNPLPEDEKIYASRHGGNPKKQNIFQEQLRAEHESFKAAFDYRRQRLGGLNGEDE